MKSSLARTFQDIVDKKKSSDRMFPDRVSKRVIVDENNAELDAESILVVQPYDVDFGSSEKTSTLLVNAALRKDYEKLNAGVDEAKNLLLAVMKEQSGSKKILEPKSPRRSRRGRISSWVRSCVLPKKWRIRQTLRSPTFLTTSFSTQSRRNA